MIPKLHKNEEYKENVETLQKMGIKYIEVFNYVIPADRKSVSEKAKANMDEFLSKLS